MANQRSKQDIEPHFDSPTTINLVQALNWYNYESDETNYKPWLKEYMVKSKVAQWSKLDIIKVMDAFTNVGRPYAAIARMEVRGINTGKRLVLDNYLRNTIKLSSYEEAEFTASNVISIRDRLEAACTPHIVWIDQQIDNFIAGHPYEDNVYEYLNGKGVKASHSKIIYKYFELSFSNITLLKKGDPDTIEYYGGYDKRTQKLLIAFYDKLESDLLQLEQTKKVQRTRKVKKVSVEKAISKVKYCKESTEFKIGSIQPQKIVGSEQLWVFNTKTRQLGRYNGSNLSFKRSSIVNYDTDLSICKKIRKPEDFLKVVLTATKSQLNKQFDSIKAVGKPLNGRLNECFVLLRVW